MEFFWGGPKDVKYRHRRMCVGTIPIRDSYQNGHI